jgi:aryl-alcohol dehydrogenase-like predicted oxidoreductase
MEPDASLSGTFKIGGDLEVNRLGFGAMRITGPGVWGEPPDRDEALRVLRKLPELKVNFVDTADSYGPEVSEKLIREALYPYTGLVIATKGGLVRTGPDVWISNGKPDYLVAQAKRSRELLGVEHIDLWQLHRIDPKVPADEQFAAVKELIDAGVIRHAGLSEVSVRDIEAARRVFPVATVQNLYNIANRKSEDVLTYCEQHDIGFIPWYPLAAGELAGAGGELDRIAKRHGATTSQIALAWALRRSRVMLPIPGTSKVAHLIDNVKAAAIHLSDHDFVTLNELVPSQR